ncbi:phosphatidylinositol 4-phosphate 5-kinase 10-like isoform X2 [Phalaenopsis equestris]|nr:phosphatidylinositol 4-phosphate 5-kinase 10-like isoform X2 [Phalaenopsis equestris]
MVVAEHEISILDFKTITSSSIRFPSDSSTDSQTLFIDVEWINYCPDVFSILQKYGKIDGNDYMTSICAQETIRQLGLYRKNSSRIYLPNDDKFFIRTISKSELKVFLEKLPNYYHHVRKYKNTLLSKFYGLHALKPSGRQKTGQPFSKVYFVVMGNVLHSDLCIHKRFDLKGFNRSGSSRTGVEESSTNEDDLDIFFHLDTPIRNMFISQVKLDCNFLEEIGATDYSLLLGLHLPSTTLGDPAKSSVYTDDRKSISSRDGSFLSEPDEDLLTTDSTQSSSSTDKTQPKFGVKLLARAFRKNGIGNLSNLRTSRKGRTYNIILFLEISDILQFYGMAKRVGSVFKSASGGNPKAYSARFQDFISQIFPENDFNVNI